MFFGENLSDIILILSMVMYNMFITKPSSCLKLKYCEKCFSFDYHTSPHKHDVGRSLEKQKATISRI